MHKRMGRQFFRKSLWCYSLATLCLMMGFALGNNLAYSQSAGGNPETKKEIRFEVFSIRPILDDRNFGWEVTPDGFTMTTNLYILIQMAYNPMEGRYWDNSKDVLHYPAWATKMYHIDARVAQEDLAAWQAQNGVVTDITRGALRAALKDRCNLTVKVTPVEVPYIDLVVGKHGAKLSESKPDAVRQIRGCGRVGKGLYCDADGKRHFIGVSMTDFVQYLMRVRNLQGDPIQDKTGLDGRYDFDLPIEDKADRSDDGTDSPVFSVPVKDIGLMLRRGRGSSFILDIVSINKPDPN